MEIGVRIDPWSGWGDDGVITYECLLYTSYCAWCCMYFLQCASHLEMGAPCYPPFIHEGTEVQRARMSGPPSWDGIPGWCGVFPSTASNGFVPCEVWKDLSRPAIVAFFFFLVLNFF